PIPFIAAGPSTEKTRVLEESLNMLQQCAENDSDSDLKKLVNNAVLINVTYGNGSAASITDSNISGEISLSLQILYRYFVEGVSDLEFRVKKAVQGEVGVTTAIDAPAGGIMAVVAKPVGKAVEGIGEAADEVNNLYELENSTFETMVKAFGSSCCVYGSIFYVPLLSETIYKPLHNIVTNLQFPVNTNHHYHRYLVDIGSHCRTLEFFYQRCSNYIVNTIDFLQVMTDVYVLLKERYAFEEFAQDNSDIIAGCLLDEAMILDERIKELRQYGIVILVENHSNGMVYLHLPYIMLWCLMTLSNKSNKLYQFWKSMIESSELFYWQNWEDFFGIKILFTLCAYCGDMLKDIIIKIPEWNSIEVHFIKERFPTNGTWTVTNLYSNEKLLIKEKSLAVYKNGESAPFDGFSYIQLKTTNSKDVIMACLQAKWRKLETAQPQKITDSMIKKEYDSTKKALADNLNLQNYDFIFVLLSICPLKQEKVNINTADIWELRLIKGVGEQLADDISLMRKRKRFDNEDDLCKRTKFPKLAVSS
ncbi:8838_t:CDS:2, partial [Funneliformis mosseae]